VTVSSYDAETGEVTFSQPLNYYHFGAADSTASEYNGVDMRGEVVILSRNIKIMGSDEDNWGCQIVTGETLEFTVDDKEITRKGQLQMHNVEMEKCSQRDNQPALRFESLKSEPSLVKGCAFHNGKGWGARVRRSDFIVFEDNVWFGFAPIGVNFDFANNCQFRNNFVGHILKRTSDSFEAKKTLDKEGAVIMCSYEANE